MDFRNLLDPFRCITLKTVLGIHDFRILWLLFGAKNQDIQEPPVFIEYTVQRVVAMSWEPPTAAANWSRIVTGKSSLQTTSLYWLWKNQAKGGNKLAYVQNSLGRRIYSHENEFSPFPLPFFNIHSMFMVYFVFISLLLFWKPHIQVSLLALVCYN